MVFRTYFSVFDPPFTIKLRGKNPYTAPIPEEDWQMGLTPEAYTLFRQLLWQYFPIDKNEAAMFGAVARNGEELRLDLLNIKDGRDFGKIHSFYLEWTLPRRTTGLQATSQVISSVKTGKMLPLARKDAITGEDFKGFLGNAMKTATVWKQDKKLYVCSSFDQAVFYSKSTKTPIEELGARILTSFHQPMLEAGTYRATVAFLRQISAVLRKQSKRMELAFKFLPNAGPELLPILKRWEKSPRFSTKPSTAYEDGAILHSFRNFSIFLGFDIDSQTTSVCPVLGKTLPEFEQILFSELYYGLLAQMQRIVTDRGPERFLQRLQAKPRPDEVPGYFHTGVRAAGGRRKNPGIDREILDIIANGR